MLKIYINSGQGEVDYTKYVIGNSIQIQRSLNTPSTCTLTMQNFDKVFKLPFPRAYLRIFSTKYNRSLFTGLLITDPTREYMGLSTGPLDYSSDGQWQQGFAGQLYTIQFSFTSDEYLLNLKTVQLLPAFVNQSQGQILRTIAETLCPGYFDYTYIASGQLVPYMPYDPTKAWSEYAKEFGDASRYRYSVVDRQIHFQPYGDGPLGISYDESANQGTFDPSALKTSALTTPIINDITVIGMQEGGNNHEDYFLGDGFTGTFPLRHQVFDAGGAPNQTSGQSGIIVLATSWSENAFDLQTYQVQDYSNEFTLPGQALNVITPIGVPNPIGTSYIQSNAALELAGGLVIQHGEAQFNNSSLGHIGGLYDDPSLNPNTCEASFYASPTASIVVTASGASGISLQPFRLGSVPTKAFQIVTKVNRTYVLSTIISSPAPARYTQVYTTLSGVVYGGASLQAQVKGSITWKISEIDQGTGQIVDYTFSLDNQLLPSFAVYGVINNQALNMSLRSTQIYAPPKGTLKVAGAVGAGLLAPIFISGNVIYTGGFTTPSGGNLPILPVASGGFGPENQYALGSSLQNQAAEIDIGTLNSSLNFYSNSLPGVGVKIHLQTWESQAAIARIQSPASISGEMAVVGDDGIRSSVITNLNPLPRTSEDCDAAGSAILTDRTNIFYQGTYQASYLFFNQYTNDIDFYPVCGRYLYVNAPRRNIRKGLLLVTNVTTSVAEMAGEIVNHAISFGPDLYLEKVIGTFIDKPTNTLLPQNTTVKLTPQQLAQVGTNYLADVIASNFDILSIKGLSVDLLLQETAIPAGSMYELRSIDANWGKNDTYLITRRSMNQTITLPRTKFDQTWYLRFVNTATGQTSRRSKVLRIYAQQVPATPAFLYADSATINCDFNGDIRNITGIELRDVTDSIVYYQGIVGSQIDMQLNLDQLRGQLPGFVVTGAVIGGKLGQYMKGVIPPTARSFNVHFFNLLWEYSPALSITIPPISGMLLNEGFRFGSAVEARVTQAPNRIDASKSLLQIALDSSFNTIILQQQQPGLPLAFHAQVPAFSGDLYVRMTCFDHISSGGWTPTLFVPQGDLIASDYLTSQGSAPPYVTSALASLFTVSAVANPSSATTADVTVSWSAFSISFPNGRVLNVPAQSTISILGPTLNANTAYVFYAGYIYGGLVAFPPDGYYMGLALNLASNRTQGLANTKLLYSDGNIPFVALGLAITTAAFPAGGSSTSNGGGSSSDGPHGGCVTDGTKITGEEHIVLAENVELLLPFKVKTPSKRKGEITQVDVVRDQPLYWLETISGRKAKFSGTQALHTGTAWKQLNTLTAADHVWTENGYELVASVQYAGQGTVYKFHLGTKDDNGPHVYLADGFWLHNLFYKY